MPANTTERGRITARVPAHAQQLIETAAGLSGATVNQFVANAALREAERVMENERLIRLSERDMTAVLDALDAPPPVSAKLAAALGDYVDRRNDTTGSLDWKPRPKQL